MTSQQYTTAKQYKPAIETFVKVGSYNERSDGLLDFYEELTGAKLNRSCSGCIAGAIMSVRQIIYDYEKNM